MREWFVKDGRLGKRGTSEQRGPRRRADLAVDVQTLRALKRPDRRIRAATEVAVDRASVQAELLQAGLELDDFGALGVELVEGRRTSFTRQIVERRTTAPT